jgi:hypothetical protein
MKTLAIVTILAVTLGGCIFPGGDRHGFHDHRVEHLR